MAWIAVDLDNTLVNPHSGEAEPGAVDAMAQLLREGHRVTIWTARFAPEPEEKKVAIKAQIEKTLAEAGVPYSDIWTGHNKPNVDAFIGDNLVTYDGNWGQSLAMLNMMLQHAGPAESDDEENS